MTKRIFKLLGLTFLTFVMITSKVSANVYSQEEIEKNMEQVELVSKIEGFILRHNNDVYPEYYGGMYISDDSLKVIIQIVEKNIPNQNTIEYTNYEEIFNISDSINIEYVSNSYNELEKVNDELKEHYLNTKNNDELNAFYVDTIKNKVVVDLKGINWKIKNDFKRNVSPSSAILLTASTHPLINYKAINAGSGIINNACSSGFRANIGGVVGIVTAAHCVTGLNQNIAGLGKVVKYNRNIDAAFIETQASHTLTNTLAYPSPDGTITTLNTRMISPTLAVNTIVAKSGAATGYSSGKVTNNNFTGNFDGLIISGLVATNANANRGDSGAPVFLPRNTSGGATPIGILVGGSPGTTNTMIFSRDDTIAGKFNYVRY